jgi:osmotically-inducible protein OsmY
MNRRFSDSRVFVRATLLGCALAAAVACAPLRPVDKCATTGCRNDAAMADKISAALRDRPGIEFWEVRVQYLDDIVYLYGLVATTPERIDIEQIARETSGGKKVVNSIEIRGDRH